MCKKCKKKTCDGCEQNDSQCLANLENQVTELQDQVSNILKNANFLLCGHPILLIKQAADIACFDSDGLGTDCWDGWAVCNGATWPSAINPKENIATPNFTDRFIVQALGNYSVGDTGGSDSVTLVVSELPAHNHGVTDPGHNHAVTDPGHNHAVTDPGHEHNIITDDPGDHQHSVPNLPYNIGGVGGAGAIAGDGSFGGSGLAGAHTHTGTAQNETTGLTVNTHVTGLTVNTHVTGLTTNDEGADAAHENRPPYFAAIYVIKL